MRFKEVLARRSTNDRASTVSHSRETGIPEIACPKFWIPRFAGITK
jgi:hypothetical protein